MREIPHEGDRVETGAVRFGDDWAGLFLRGDDAIYLGLIAKSLADEVVESPFVRDFLIRLYNIVDTEVRS